MEILLKRIYKGPEYTIGNLYVDNKYICDTIEDTDRGLTDSMTLSEINKLKVKGKTAIPTGTYDVTLKVTSPKYSNYNKYPWAREINGKLPRLLNVKGFEGILIHVGNLASDTDGCILVGENKVKGQVLYSRVTFNKLYKILQSNKDDCLTIKII